ncbi:hypothetical protein PBI_ISOLDE_82 [Arthrobacter phage Isolde]|uniref:Uncharacterized protein n=1 Tax=Arthrobacter phage Isolde TaxID=2419610 RepID=A0A3G3M3N6_9CAUD|nr:hypothetical protein PP638_gp21 [Arthrobacter phage Isolde]AYR01050.1 hypothetical protein PBI_ISOLDE_82 [Arthrobacter phage Isolde]
MTAEKRNPTTRAECGTVAGWNAHNRARERQCMPCKIAKTDYTREWRHRTGRNQSSLYTPQDIAAIKAHALREASDAYPLETAYGGAEHAVNWLRERAEHIEAVPTGAASVIQGDNQ